MYLILKTKNNLNILQQNYYNLNNRYIKWGINKINKIFDYDIIIVLINLFNLYLKNKYLLLINITYILLLLNQYNKNKMYQVKIPFKTTNRIKRMLITITLLYLIPFIFYKNIYLLSFLFTLLVFINYIIVYIANIINKPIEYIILLYYKIKSLKRLKSMHDLKIVGITGSYGKTSTKNILNDILSIKYNIIATPKSYNTLYGLIITINKYLNKFDDVFIGEMGAFKVGRIKLLCKFLRPKYGILTNIGLAHLETFKTRDNIQKCKFELIDSLDKDGVGILNKDDLYQVNYKIKSKAKIIWIGIDNKDVDIYASNIIMDKNGTTFDVILNKENKSYSFKTKLLGKENIYNILESIAFSKYVMNMDINDIKLGVEKVKVIPHRLEIKNMEKFTIIDDAYNSNPVGSSMALDVLSMMDGYKIIVTPGMIELGDKEYILNKEFGEKISEVADYVILVGDKETKAIKEGLLSKNYSLNKISIINEFKDTFSIINNIKVDNNIYILLENDLPDIYNK